VSQLAQQLIDRFGAPDLAAATAAAEEEVAFAESLAVQDKDVLVAVHRTYEEGEVRETFRTLRPRSGPRPLRAFSFLDVEDGAETPDETIELASLAERERK
jgi:hypothetical protein